jgi:hypothetical protein
MQVASQAANKKLTFYDSASKTNAIAVASAVVPGGAFTGAEQNSSGLTITGTMSAAITNGDKSITIKQITHSWTDDVHSDGWFSFQFDTGYEAYKLTDCQSKSFKFSAGGKEGIRFDWDIVSLSFAEPVTTLTASIADNAFLLSRDVTLTYDSAGGDYNMPTEGGFSLEMSYDITAGPDNAAGPEYFRRDNLDGKVTINTVPSDETNTIQDNARAVTFKTLGLDMSYGDTGLTMEFTDALSDPNTVVQASGKAVSNQALNFMLRADLTDTTPTLATVKTQWRA